MFKEKAVMFRARGVLNMSMATSLALEGFGGIHPTTSNDPNCIRHYDALYINLRTLHRNAYYAIDAQQRDFIHQEEILKAIYEDMGFINEWISNINQEWDTNIKVVYYASRYLNITSKHPMATLREDNTFRQSALSSSWNMIIGAINKDDYIKYKFNYQVFDKLITFKEHRRLLVLTHVAYDLLANENSHFRTFDLLESHTGKIKSVEQFNSKYHNGKKLSNMPFNENFLMIFGDDFMIRPMDRKIRYAIIEQAELDRWSPIIQRSAVRYSINKLKDPVLKNQILSLLH